MTTPTSSSLVSSVPASSITYIDALLSGEKWGAGVGTGLDLTYSFPGESAVWSTAATSLGGYGPRYGTGEPWSADYAPLNESQKAYFRAALATWAEVTNVRFVEVQDTATRCGDIRVAFTGAIEPNTSAHAYYPYDRNGSGGDVWISPYTSANDDPSVGTFGFMIYVHETGHALGLKHPFDDSPTLSAAYDTTQYTVMSYEDQPGTDTFPVGPQLYDIAAIQYIYGPNMSTRTGNDSYRFSDTAEEVRAIWDAGGTDTLDASNQTRGASIDLAAGAFSSIGVRSDGSPASNNIAIAYGVVIENANGGSGDDTITGNAAANVIATGGGADVVSAGPGNDTVNGNAGADMINGNEGDDSVAGGRDADSVYGGRGDDTVNGNMEADLVFGNMDADLLYGGQDDDTLYGGQGNDTLYGDRANDWLWGDRGDDTLTGGMGADTFAFATGSGTDVILDFNAADGDRISLAPGRTYTLGVAGGDATLVFADGQVALRNVTPAQFSTAWIV